MKVLDAVRASAAQPAATRRAGAPAVTFWGVRGSVPVAGPDTVVFGGNTTCLEVEAHAGSGRHSVIIDAGSGIRALGRSRDWAEGARIDILFSHLHHDHVIGLPFFRPLFMPGRELHLWCGNLGGETAKVALDRMFSPPLFPLRLDEVPARIVFHGFRAGETLDVGGAAVRTAPLNHPSGATGYRFDGAEGSLAVITDIEHGDEAPCPRVVALCSGVDTLVYDSMLEETDYARCRGWGHSTIDAGLALAAAAGVRRLVGCHHAPEHDDSVMAAREARLAAAWPGALMAREGLRLVCAPGGRAPV